MAATKAACAGGVIEVVPEKPKSRSGVRLRIPEHPDLARVLDAAPKTGSLTLLTRPDGKPWKEDHFNHVSGDAVKAAGLSGLTFHGLRNTASGWLADAGATDAEIDSILGHVDPKMTRLYRRQANQEIRATAAMEKLAKRRIGSTDCDKCAGSHWAANRQLSIAAHRRFIRTAGQCLKFY